MTNGESINVGAFTSQTVRDVPTTACIVLSQIMTALFVIVGLVLNNYYRNPSIISNNNNNTNNGSNTSSTSKTLVNIGIYWIILLLCVLTSLSTLLLIFSGLIPVSNSYYPSPLAMMLYCNI